MTQEFYTILTKAGKKKESDCLSGKGAFDLWYIAVGDSNGNFYEPEENQASLKNECWRELVANRGEEIDEKGNITKFATIHIPANAAEIAGKFIIREIGGFDKEGNLLIVGKVPENLIDLPKIGITGQNSYRLDLSVINELALPFLIDPSINTATVEYCDKNYQKISEKGEAKGYAPLDENSIVPLIHLPEELKMKTSGLPIGFIGQTVLPIDESLCLQRYLNGQIIIQDQFVSFTNKIKEAVELYPNLATTEENWQTEKALSAFGQVGKFVIDDNAGTIRLPAVVNTQGLFDLTKAGFTVEAGLPNINGVFGGTSSAISGAFEFGEQTGAINTGTQYALKQILFNASKSNPIYGNSDTVQQEAVRYPYFIQVATGVEESLPAIREYQINTSYSLLQPIWSDTKLNNESWLRSNGQANYKAKYTDSYDLLLIEYNSGVDETETVGGIEITFRRGADRGFKVTKDIQAFNAIYQAIGTAWYYVIDTENETFYLPQSNGFMQFSQSDAGNFVEAGLPNITGELNAGGSGGYNLTTGAFSLSEKNVNTYTHPTQQVSIKAASFDASKSNDIYGKSDTVQPPSTEGYLYFFVGDVIQNATLVNTGRIQEQLIDKLDKDLSNCTKPYVKEMNVNGLSGYIEFSTGLLVQWGRTPQGTQTTQLVKEYKENNYIVLTTWEGTITQSWSSISIQNRLPLSFESYSAAPRYWLTIGK